jgi:F-type H+-transporting ATPase subunit b
MQIDWSQLVTNILGFLLLFWGLKRFAWGPILGMLDERRESIAGSFRQIEEGKQENQGLRDELEQQLRDIDATGRKKIEEATTEGARVAGEIKDEARADARKLVDKAQLDILHERAKARIELRDDIVAMAVTGAEKILHERLDREAQEKLVNRFIDELESSRNA